VPSFRLCEFSVELSIWVVGNALKRDFFCRSFSKVPYLLSATYSSQAGPSPIFPPLH